MKQFTLHYKNFKKWLRQNDGMVTDVVQGCLLDNYFIDCKNGFAIAYETYKNHWSSIYTIKFVRVGGFSNLVDEWDAFENESREMEG